MAVVKSDAMIMAEKAEAEILSRRPKHSNHNIMHIEVRNYVVAAAIIGIIVFAALAMMQ
jgi:hypothetical protein